MAQSSFFKSDGSSTTLQTNLTDKAADAEKLAINPEDDQFTLSDGTTTGYSALHHKEKAIDAQTASETAKTAAETARDAAAASEVASAAAEVAAETAETNAAASAAAALSSKNAAALLSRARSRCASAT